MVLCSISIVNAELACVPLERQALLLLAAALDEAGCALHRPLETLADEDLRRVYREEVELLTAAA